LGEDCKGWRKNRSAIQTVKHAVSLREAELVMLNHFTTSAVLPVKRRIICKMISILR